MPNSKGNDFSIKQTFKVDTLFQMALYLCLKVGTVGRVGWGGGGGRLLNPAFPLAVLHRV